MQCVDGFSLYNKGMLDKVTTHIEPSIFRIFLHFIERNQLNAAHAQLLEKLRPIAFAETCRLLTIKSLEFQEISHTK